MAIDLAVSRAVLIGVSAYEDPEFPGLRAARNSVDTMREMLSDPRLCGWPPERITVICNPVSAEELALEVATLTKGTGEDGALLVYYVGHGVLSDDGGLHLTVVSTRSDHPEITALRWETVARELRRCGARVRLAILDCCFSGQIIEALGADSAPGLADMAHVEGVYTLTATTRNRLAHVPPPDQQVTACTSFTGELRDLVYAGIAGKPARLTMTDLFPVLYARLRARGLPLPNQRGTGTAALFPFTVNAAVHPLPPGTIPFGELIPSLSGSFRSTAPERVQRLLREARSIAESIPESYIRDPALARVGQAMPPDGPESAVGAATWSRLSALGRQAVTTAHPDEAEYLAQAISDKPQKSLALASVAVKVAVAGQDPDRVGRLLSEAERAALSIRFAGYERAQALAHIAQAVAAVESGRAERLAASIRRKVLRVTTTADLARAAVSTSPEYARRLLSEAEPVARSIRFDGVGRSEALASIAQAFTAIDPHQAERIALSIRRKTQREESLAGIAQAILATDPDQAERLARTITSKSRRASALARIARDLPVADDGRIERLLGEAERAAQSIYSLYERRSALAEVASKVAGAAPELAERLALALPDPWQKAHILARIAQAMPPDDPRRVRLVANVYRLVRPITGRLWMDTTPDTDTYWRDKLADITDAMSPTSPDLAMDFIHAINPESWKAYALACAAYALAEINPGHADQVMSDVERITRTITFQGEQVALLVCIAGVWARGTQIAHATGRMLSREPT